MVKSRGVLVTCSLFVLFALVSRVKAADETFIDQFIGSPLLILVALLIIVLIAFAYHRIRK